MDYNKSYYHTNYFEGTSSSNFSRRLLLNSSNTGLSLSSYSPLSRATDFIGHHSPVTSSRYNHLDNHRLKSRPGIIYNPTSDSPLLPRRKELGTSHNAMGISSFRRHHLLNADPKMKFREIDTSSKIINESGNYSFNKLGGHDFALSLKHPSQDFVNTINTPYSSSLVRPQMTNFTEYLRAPVTNTLPSISDYIPRTRNEREVNPRSVSPKTGSLIPNENYKSSNVTTPPNSKSRIEEVDTSIQNKIDSSPEDSNLKYDAKTLDLGEDSDKSNVFNITAEYQNTSITSIRKDSKTIQNSFVDNKSSVNLLGSEKDRMCHKSPEHESLETKQATQQEEAAGDNALKTDEEEENPIPPVNAETIPENPHRRHRYRCRNTSVISLETDKDQNVTSRCRSRIQTEPDIFLYEKSVGNAVTTSRDRIRIKSAKPKMDKSPLELLNISSENHIPTSLERTANRNTLEDSKSETGPRLEENVQRKERKKSLSKPKPSSTVSEQLIDSKDQTASSVFVETLNVNSSAHQGNIVDLNINKRKEEYVSNTDTICGSDLLKSNIKNQCEPLKSCQTTEKLDIDHKTDTTSVSYSKMNHVKSKVPTKTTECHNVDTKNTTSKVTYSNSKCPTDSKQATKPNVIKPQQSVIHKSQSELSKTTIVSNITADECKTSLSSTKPISKQTEEKVVTAPVRNSKELKEDKRIGALFPEKKVQNTEKKAVINYASIASPLDEVIKASFRKSSETALVSQGDYVKQSMTITESELTTSNESNPIQNGISKEVHLGSNCSISVEQSKNNIDIGFQSNEVSTSDDIQPPDQSKQSKNNMSIALQSNKNSASVIQTPDEGKHSIERSKSNTDVALQIHKVSECDVIQPPDKSKTQITEEKLNIEPDKNCNDLMKNTSSNVNSLPDSKHTEIPSTKVVEETKFQCSLVNRKTDDFTIKLDANKSGAIEDKNTKLDFVEIQLKNEKPLSTESVRDNVKKTLEFKTPEPKTLKSTLKDSLKPNKTITTASKAETVLNDTSSLLIGTNKENILTYINSSIIPSTVPEQKSSKKSDTFEIAAKTISENNESKPQESFSQKVTVPTSVEPANTDKLLGNKSGSREILTESDNILSANNETCKHTKQRKIKNTEKKVLIDNKFLILKEVSKDISLTSPVKPESQSNETQCNVKTNSIIAKIDRKPNEVCSAEISTEHSDEKISNDIYKSNECSAALISTEKTDNKILSNKAKSKEVSATLISTENSGDGSRNLDFKGSVQLDKNVKLKDCVLQFQSTEISTNANLHEEKISTCETTDINSAESNISLNTEVTYHATENGNYDVKPVSNISCKLEPVAVNEESTDLTQVKTSELSETLSFGDIVPTNTVDVSMELPVNKSTQDFDPEKSTSNETQQMTIPPIDTFPLSADDICSLAQAPCSRNSSHDSGESYSSSMSTEDDTESEDESFKRECEEFDNKNKLDNVSYQRSTSIQQQADDLKKLRFRKYDIDDFVFLKVLGEGAFGKVVLAELKDHNMYFAVKSLKKRVVLKDEDADGVIVEKKILSLGIQHPFICKLYFTFQTEGCLFFVMEYLVGGDLLFHIQKRPFSKNRTRFYGAEIISGLRFLHKRGIVYRDLKLDNVMLDIEGHVRLVDFGLCECGVYSEEAWHFVGTPAYMAPEILERKKYNQSVDWWSFGVLMYEMAFGRLPFKGTDEDELFWSICHEEPSYSEFMAFDLKDVLKKLLKKSPNDRLGMPTCPTGSVEEHNFFREVDWDRLVKKEIRPPFKPHVSSPSDTHNFSNYSSEDSLSFNPTNSEILELKTMNQDVFKGFSYTNPYVIG